MKLIDAIILLILAALAALAIRYIVKRKKSGRPIGCTGNCENCALHCSVRNLDKNGGNEDEQKKL